MASFLSTDPNSQRPPLPARIAAVIWLALIFIAGLALCGTRPPAAVGASAPANVFCSARAITHLAGIANQPHPIGSDENARVREYLVEQLRELGSEVHVEQAIGSVRYGRTLHAGLVNNIVATFHGQSNSRAIMLVAHYDSVPEGPGAADDGAGLIVILEAIRALRAGPPVKNDLIVLFTDGEEAHGLLGAQAFAADHPGLSDRIGLVINLEARGSSGPAMMFETSNDNGALIREFEKAAPYPTASSLMAAIYKLLPNDTDFTPLKAAGIPGFNFAFIENYAAYHSRLDTIENLDPRSVQHLGENVSGIIRHFGNLTLPLEKQPDLVYFNWFASCLFVYPSWLARAIAVCLLIVFTFACIRSRSRFGLSLGGTVVGFASFFLQLLIAMGASFAGFAAAKVIAREFLEGDTLSNQLVFAGIMGITFGVALASQHFLRRKLGLANLAVGQVFAVCLVSLFVCWFLVGGSYVLQWPLVFGIAGIFLGLRTTGPARSVWQLVFLIPALMILVPFAYMLFVGLLFTYAALGAVAFVLAIFLALAVPLFDRLAGRREVNLAVIFLLSASLIGAGIRLSIRSAIHPRRDTLIYSFNADENKAKWVSYDAAPDPWTREILGSNSRNHLDPAYVAGLERPVLTSEAGHIPLAAPSITVLQNTTIGGVRTLKLQLASSRGARSILVRVPSVLKLEAAGWNGTTESIYDNSQANVPWSFRFYNLPPEGASLELRFPARNPIRIWVADTTAGLPPVAPLRSRPNDTMPGYGSDVTLVARSHEL
jgi:hypothetical protein